MLHCETCSVKNRRYRYIQIIEATHSSSQRRSMWIGGTPPPNHRSSLKPAAPPPAAGFFLLWALFYVVDWRPFPGCTRCEDKGLVSPLDFRGVFDFRVKATSAEIRLASITISLCLDKYAQFCGGAPSRPIA
jgi:hypothetical protein